MGAHRLQHGLPRRPIGGSRPDEPTLALESGQPASRLPDLQGGERLLAVARPEDFPGRGTIERAVEDRQRAKPALLRCREQLVAPVERCPEGSTAVWQTAVAPIDDRQLPLDPHQHGGWGENRHPLRRQLDHEWQPSSRRQISLTVAADSASSWKEGHADRARSTNSSTAGDDT